MPDEHEMAEIHDAMDPQQKLDEARHVRRRAFREQQAAPNPDRFTGVHRCNTCGFELELEREPIPERCPACGFLYEREAMSDAEAGAISTAYEAAGLKRRQAFALESIAGAGELVAEAINRLTDLVGEVAEVIGDRTGKPPRR